MDQSGIGRYASALIRHLADLDNEFDYVVFVRADTLDRWVDHPRLKPVLADVGWYTLAEQHRMPRLVAQSRVDLLHAPFFNAPLLSRKPLALTVHDLTHLRSSARPDIGAPRRLAFSMFLRAALRRAQAVIVPSMTTAHALKEFAPHVAGKLHPIQQGFDRSHFPSTEPTAMLRWQAARPYWLAVGNFHPHKNLPRLVEAFAQATRDGLDGRLVLAGDPGGRADLVLQLAHRLGVEERVVVTGRITDGELSALYQNARGLAFISLSEGFGLPCLEAFSFGLPVLASTAGSLPEVVGEGGWLVAPNDVGAIASGLRHLAFDQEARARLQRTGTERLREFSWQRTAEETAEVYRVALRRSGTYRDRAPLL